MLPTVRLEMRNCLKSRLSSMPSFLRRHCTQARTSESFKWKWQGREGFHLNIEVTLREVPTMIAKLAKPALSISITRKQEYTLPHHTITTTSLHQLEVQTPTLASGRWKFDFLVPAISLNSSARGFCVNVQGRRTYFS